MFASLQSSVNDKYTISHVHDELVLKKLIETFKSDYVINH
jgi:hypothetical protein